MTLREMLEAGSRARLDVDVDRIAQGMEAAAAAFTRRRAAPEPTAAPAWRRRLRRLAAAFCSLEDELHALDRDEAGLQRARRASLRLWGSADAMRAWRGHLEGLRAQAEAALAIEASRPGRPGQRQDRATRRLVLDVAQVLHREGLPLSTQPDGLLASVTAAVARQAGHVLPTDERGLRRLLRPAVRFHKGEGAIPSASDTKDTLPNGPPDPLPCLAAEEGEWVS